jgi:hypothetical protein
MSETAGHGSHSKKKYEFASPEISGAQKIVAKTRAKSTSGVAGGATAARILSQNQSKDPR